MMLPVREVDTVAELNEIFRALTEGGRVVHAAGGRTVVLLADGTYMTCRATSSIPPHEPAVDINAGGDRAIRIYTPPRDSE